MATTADTREPQVDNLADLVEGALLAEAAETEAVLREAAVHQLRVAYQWAVSHPALDAAETPDGPSLPGVLTEPETLGGDGTPAVAAFTTEPLAVATGISPAAAGSLIADALDLHHRLPLLWDQVQAQLVPVWKARRVASRTRDLSAPAAAWVDRQVAGRVSSLGAAALDRLVAEAAARCDGDAQVERERASQASWDVWLAHPDPRLYSGTSELRAVGDTLDLTRFHDVVCAEAEALGALGDTDELGVRKAKALGVIADAQARLDLASVPAQGPEETSIDDAATHDAARRVALRRRDAKVRLYLHASLADVVAATAATTGGAARTGTVEGLGPLTLETIREWAGRSRVTVQPVIHVAADDRWSVQRHDPPPQMADEVRLRDGCCVFPWCSRPARQCDLDHRQPFDHASELGQRSRNGTRRTQEPSGGGPPGGPPDGGEPPGDATTGTTPANLAPLCRRHHRAKTAGVWRYERIDPGTYLWTGTAGLSALVTSRGTIRLPG